MRDVKIKANADFSSLSYIRLGGMAALVAYPKNSDELIFTIFAAEEYKIPYRILGRMTNTLPPDGICNILLIKTDRMKNITATSDTVIAECGVSLPALSAYFMQRGLSGLEELSGIPASIGGAIYMNAGAYGKEISDVISELFVLDVKTRKIEKLKRESINFSYRQSPFSKGNYCILSAGFKYEKKDPDEIASEMSRIAKKRRETQPKGSPSLGSTFKRSGDVSAALLIDRAGLKGIKVGGVKVSEKHAGFIINDGGKKSSDYRVLCELIKDSVFRKYGIMLEEEIEYL